MNKIAIVAITIAAIACTVSVAIVKSAHRGPNLVGRWVTIPTDPSIAVDFQPDNHVDVTEQGGGHTVVLSGTYTTKPDQIDISFVRRAVDGVAAEQPSPGQPENRVYNAKLEASTLHVEFGGSKLTLNRSNVQ